MSTNGLISDFNTSNKITHFETISNAMAHPPSRNILKIRFRKISKKVHLAIENSRVHFFINLI